MTKIPVPDWTVFELAVELNERPTQIGSMLFKLLEDAGYTVDEIRAVAKTLLAYAA